MVSVAPATTARPITTRWCIVSDVGAPNVATVEGAPFTKTESIRSPRRLNGNVGAVAAEVHRTMIETSAMIVSSAGSGNVIVAS